MTGSINANRALSHNGTAVYFNVAAVSTVCAAANPGATVVACRCDHAAINGYLATIAFVAAANTSST